MTANARQKAYLDAMGIQSWALRHRQEAATDSELLPATEARVVTAHEGGADDWQTLAARVSHCTACDLSRTRTQTVQ